MSRVLQDFPVYFQRSSIDVSGSVQHSRDMDQPVSIERIIGRPDAVAAMAKVLPMGKEIADRLLSDPDGENLARAAPLEGRSRYR
jgi:hypothetical protein